MTRILTLHDGSTATCVTSNGLIYFTERGCDNALLCFSSGHAEALERTQLFKTRARDFQNTVSCPLFPCEEYYLLCAEDCLRLVALLEEAASVTQA